MKIALLKVPTCLAFAGTFPSIAAAMVSSSQHRVATFQPVHIYPYESDLAAIKATQKYASLKRFHFLRHAEGTHNVDRAYRDVSNLDARLTNRGKEQCQSLAQTLLDASTRVANDESSPNSLVLKNTELIVTSPLTRCIQTVMLSFPTLTSPSMDDNNNNVTPRIPFVAHESIRETVNYNCDRRRAISELEPHYHERICFRAVEHDHDEIWESYVKRLGEPHVWNKARESAELHVVADRARTFFQWIRNRPEREIVICTHSAFLRCLFGWGQRGGVQFIMHQALDERSARGQEVPVLEYCGDAAFEKFMRQDFDNCELRSFVAAFPRPPPTR